jgi:aryl carrier-like protein
MGDHASATDEIDGPQDARDMTAQLSRLRDRVAHVITAIWREVLDSQAVGLNDNFFDLGGNSLMMVKIYSRLRRAGMSDRPILDLFRYSTIAMLVQAMPPEELSAMAASSPPELAAQATGPSLPTFSNPDAVVNTTLMFEQVLQRGAKQREAFSSRRRGSAGESS